jgi:hypothetical protein
MSTMPDALQFAYSSSSDTNYTIRWLFGNIQFNNLAENKPAVTYNVQSGKPTSRQAGKPTS